jgi:3-oxoacyl-[acyl-carrier-protein] synthase II
MRRVVVTGLGAITPLGVGQFSDAAKPPISSSSLLLILPGIRRIWQRLIEGHCGIVSTTKWDDRYGGLPSQVAGVVPAVPTQEGGWHPQDCLTKHVRRCVRDKMLLCLMIL